MVRQCGIMDTMDRGVGTVTRWGRALLLSGVALLTGVIAHVGAGGLLPGPVVLLVLLAGCMATAASLLGRPASTLRIVLLLMAGQTLIHGVMTALGGHRGDPPLTPAQGGPAASALPADLAATGGRRVGSLYDQVYAGVDPAGAALSIPAPVQHLIADFTGAHAVMALAHLAAAALVGLWLAVGERALWTVLTLVAESARPAVAGLLATFALAVAHLRPVGEALAHARRLGIARAPTRLRRTSDLLARSVVRRGPPALLTV